MKGITGPLLPIHLKLIVNKFFFIKSTIDIKNDGETNFF